MPVQTRSQTKRTNMCQAPKNKSKPKKSKPIKIQHIIQSPQIDIEELNDLEIISRKFHDYYKQQKGNVDNIVNKIANLIKDKLTLDWDEIDYISVIINHLYNANQHGYILTITEHIPGNKFYTAYGNSDLGLSYFYMVHKFGLCSDFADKLKPFINVDKYILFRTRHTCRFGLDSNNPVDRLFM